MEGYNISLQIGTKTLLGRTQDDLNISANVKESLTKDDAGATKYMVTSHTVTFSVSAILALNGSTSTQLDRDDVIELALKTGADAKVAVKYLCNGGDTYGGEAIITGYTESSSASADEDATISLNLQISGAFTKQTS